MTIQQLVYSVRQAAQTLAVSRVTIYALHKTDPSFPRIFKLTGRSSGLLVSELTEWAEAQRATRRIDGKHVKFLASISLVDSLKPETEISKPRRGRPSNAELAARAAKKTGVA